MRLRNRITLVLGIAMLLAPVAMLAADTVAEPAAAATSSTETSATTPAATATEPTTPAAVSADKPRALEQCDKATGSMIRPSKKNDCKPPGSLPTRTYTKEDIERTGEIDINQALRKLDPRFY